MKIKTIFFDIYQTLIHIDDSGNEESWNVFSRFLNDQGIFLDSFKFQEEIKEEKQKYYNSVHDSEMKFRHHNLLNLIDTVFSNHGIKIEKDKLLDLIWEFRQLYVSGLNLYNGARSILDELSQKYVLSTASYTQGSYTKNELKKLGIDKYFSHFIFSSDIGYKKTDENFYRICLEKTNSKAEESLMIGDNYLEDIVIPKKIGFNAILIKNPLTYNGNVFNNIVPDKIIDLKDILKLPSIIRLFDLL
jgi:putative hydrolase of the HAD superfamily